MPIKKSELYASLWKSCDELRGGMDASQYKDYVLVLLFVKYVSDKAASQKGYDLEVPKGGSFADMVALKGDKEIGDKIRLANRRRIELRVPVRFDHAGRLRVLAAWYRDVLRGVLMPLIAKWEALLGVEVAAVGIKRMKTKWGSCNTTARRVWFNLELAKKDAACIEYVVVHELSHLIVRNHDAHFVALMDQHLPRWRAVRDVLNASPLAEETWRSSST